MSKAATSPGVVQQDLGPWTQDGKGLSANPLRPALFGFAVIAAFVAAVVVWAFFAPMSGAATAEGALQVEGRRQAVQHPYGGVVNELFVKEGDVVDKGQLLLTLADTEPRSRLDVLVAERNALLAEEARLLAERDGVGEPAFGKVLLDQSADPGVVQAMGNERAVMVARSRQYESEKGLLEQRIVLLQEQKRGSKAQLDGLRRQADLIEEEAKGARYLLAGGMTPKTRVLALERDAAKLLADQGAKLSDIASTDEAVGSANLEIAKLQRNRTTEVTSALRAAQSRLAENAPKIDAAKDVLARTRIVAPASGAVIGLSVFTQGGVIQQGSRLLDVVPRDHPLMVEARLRLTDVGEVAPGRSADVRLTNFNRNERPTIRGEVVTVSADRLTDERSGQGYYSVLVRMHPEDVGKSSVELQAGMPAQVVVTTRPRTMLDYLVAPLVDQIAGAFREK